MSTDATTPPALAGYGLAVLLDEKPRCWKCGRVVVWYAPRPWKAQCRHCLAINVSPGIGHEAGPKGGVASCLDRQTVIPTGN